MAAKRLEWFWRQNIKQHVGHRNESASGWRQDQKQMPKSVEAASLDIFQG